MGPDNKKRKSSKTPARQSKRQKTQAAKAKPKQPLSVNALAWARVDVPEMFNDAEGFFGLEEVHGVEIIKEGDTVKFMAAGGPKESAAESDEFLGFDDSPVASEGEKGANRNASATPAPASTAAKASSKEQKKSKDPKSSKDKKPSKDQKQTKDQKKKKAQPANAKGQDDPELETDLFSKAGDLADASDDEDIDMSEWVSLNLSPEMLSSLARMKFSKPTAIQSSSIPEIMEGHDVVGKASTGSGKTLAFGIPIVESWLSRMAAKGPSDKNHHPTALILSPTRELAHQIKDHFKQLCLGLTNSPYICSVTGGLSMQKQERQLEKADVIIGTPGRLWEVLSTSTSTLKSLRNIRFLVIDEADRLLKDGLFKEAEEILKALDRPPTTNERGGYGGEGASEEEVDDDDDEEGEEEEETDDSPPRRQTLVFSATFNKNLQQKLAGKARVNKDNLMGDSDAMEYLLAKLNFGEEVPKFIDANPVSQMAEGLKEGLLQCGEMEKDLYLYAVLLLQPAQRTLVFTNSINSVRRLTPLLQNLNLPAFPLHSDMAQKARMRSIERFKEAGSASAPSSSAIMIATDVAARGLDIPGIGLVIHYHVPRTADDYVHRSGRTARASSLGISVMLCGPKEAVPTQRLIAKVHASAGRSSRIGRFASKVAGESGDHCVQTIDIDRKLVSRLRERVALSKKITDASLAKEKGHKEDAWMKAAADELGVEYDEDELEDAGQWSGRGSGRRAKEKESRALTKAELAPLRAALREMLATRINTGVSEKYLTGINVEALLHGVKGEFLGSVDGLGLE
ncbi:P-loop containing nucleoside triphosphate hydrolase protein [Lasiosphaeria miniovina]|uniref:ATP-dependent RNA helicase n=1 Tax=Lasiosphaeria miniovina TaxID=1954250 RepID=A0AA40A5N1_9PEZI|nr:P-loop containing nucleoside triphosphate hydrolase protein [Lasiosphaeria miniovina]KAK0709636.1 P-loop containing nucleoside triphosphate hydrolase protein [Lasiosphaeria miniovina]